MSNFTPDQPEFWRTLLEKVDEPSILSNRNNGNSKPEFKESSFIIQNAVSQNVIKLVNGNDLGVYTLFLSATQFLIQKVLRNENVSIKIPKFSKNSSSVNEEFLYLIQSIQEDIQLKVLIGNTKSNLGSCYKHQTVYGATLDTWHKIEENKEALTNVEVAYHNLHQDWNCSSDVRFILYNQDSSLSIKCHYNHLVVSEDVIDSLGNAFNEFFNCFGQLDITLKDIKLINEHQRKELIDLGTGPKTEITKSVVDAIKQHAINIPNNPALQDVRESLTWKELDQKSNALAHKIQELGITKGDHVAVLLPKSNWIPLSLVAILKCGAVYVPIDPQYPEDRIKYTLEDSKAKLALTDRDLPYTETPTLNPFEEKNLSNNIDEVHIETSLYDPAYVIYTSGSTGKPKGAINTHLGLINFSLSFIEAMQLNENDSVLQFTSSAFDVSLFELCTSLVCGMKICIPEKSVLENVNTMTEYVNKNNISVLFLTPPYIGLMDEKKFSTVRVLASAGEAARAKDAKRFSNHLKFFNGYGPSEAAICVSIYDVPEVKGNSVPIGRPIDNSHFYITDDNMNLLPKGFTGELCVSGAGIGLGYLNRPSLSEEKFIVDPFQENQRMYLTGDLARWLPNGEMEFIGRKDQQVKIRGYRIELEEIQHQIESHEAIDQAVVLALHLNEQEPTLGAFIVKNENSTVSQSELEEFIGKSLPNFMIPAIWVFLDEIPVTTNGKVDRKTLIEKVDLTKGEIKPASTDIEKRLVEMVSELLNINEVGINYSFFQLGGQSLSAIKLNAFIEDHFNIRLDVKAIFNAKDLEALAGVIESTINSDGDLSTAVLDIQIIPDHEHYDLSPAQKRLWLLDQIQGGTQDYNISSRYSITSKFSSEQLETAFRILIERHEALRTNFIEIDGVPKQIIHEQPNFVVNEIDLSGSGSKEFNKQLKEILDQENNYVFNLEKDQLLRVTLVQEDDDAHHLIFVMHHIVTDGWSMELLKTEFVQILNSIVKQETLVLPELPIRYRDYSKWQNDLLSSTELDQQQKFWHETLSGELPLMDLHLDGTPHSEMTNKGSRYTVFLNEKQLHSLKNVGRTTDSSIFMVLLSAFNILLSRVLDSNDIIIGTPIAGRNHYELKSIIGNFLNTVVLRNQIKTDISTKDFIAQVRTNTLNALNNQNYPFEQLVDDLNIPRDTNRFPITSVFVNMLNFGFENPGKIHSFDSKHQGISNKIKFDLNFYLEEYENGLRISCDYKNELLNANSVEILVSRLVKVIESFSNLSLPVDEIDTGEALHKPNNIGDAKWYSGNKNIVEIFSEQVSIYKNNLAVKDHAGFLTYTKLDQLSDGLAYQLTSKFNTPSKIGICTEHNRNMPIAVFGSLKAGGTYIPLDPAYPKERIQEILNQTQPEVIIVDGTTKDLFKNLINTELLILEETELMKSGETKIANSEVTAKNNAYILYTSGSTGKPKGVVQSHASVLHFISQYSNALNISANDVLTGFSSICFDSFVNDMFGAILNGATYVPISLKTNTSISDLVNLINNYGVTIWHSVPGVFRQYAELLTNSNEANNTLRIIKMTGEASTLSDFNLFKNISSKECEFVVSYGSTESTLNAIKSYDHNTEVNKSILSPGKVVSRTHVAIQRSNNTLASLLEPGEILIHSDFITTGYYNNQELNSTSFVTINDQRYYKTGDIGKILSDGSLEILGRADGQVKIRGVRVELNEIREVLIQHPQVSSAVIKVVKDQDQQSQIVAYYVGNSESTELRSFLANKLPDYFIPSYYVPLEQIPTTPNGKVDRNALPEPLEEHLSRTNTFVEPSTKMEIQIANIWKEVLGISSVGTKDNFFELGGHSLKATAFIARFKKRHGIAIPLQVIFENPTVEHIANYSQDNGQRQFENIDKAPKLEHYPLTSAQKRLFLLNQFDETSLNYNMPAVSHIYGELNFEQFNKAFKQLVDRHESLRTNFVGLEDDVFQTIRTNENFAVEYAEDSESNIDRLISDFIRPFNLQNDLLFRVKLVKLQEKHHLLLFDMHHIISDGHSIGVIKNDFIKLYNEVALEPLKIQFKDYAHWYNNQKKNGKFNAHQEHWLTTLEEPVPTLELPYDYPRPELQSFAGDTFNFAITKEQWNRLNQFSNDNGVTTYMILLAAYKILLHKFSGNQDLTVGSPISGRFDDDLENLIGMFVNTLVIRSQPKVDKSFIEYLKEVKTASVKAFDHQLFSFEEIVEQLNLERDLSRNPLFDTMFVLQDQPEIETELKAKLSFEAHARKNKSSKFDLSLMAFQREAGINFVMEYCTDLFNKDSITKFSNAYLKILTEVLVDPNLLIGEIDILDSDELKKIHGFNSIKDFKISHTVSEQIELHLKSKKSNVAISFKEQEISYEQLDTRVKDFQQVIGNISGERIALVLSKSTDCIATIVAILETGNSYIPIDPKSPENRINYILDDANVKAIFVEQEANFSDNITVWDINNLPKIDTTIERTNKASLEQEAYIIYTSGSTGQPKGVSVSHRALIEKLEAEKHLLNWSENLTTIFTSNYTFDASLLEIFPPLYFGGTLVIPEEDRLLDFQYIHDLINKNNINVIQGTTSYFKTFLQNTAEIDSEESSIQHFCIGGESLTAEVVNELRKRFPNAQINNHYGPTEATIDAIVKTNVKTFGKNIIGKPMPNTATYILNGANRPVPIGVLGEICLSGKSIANGYINRPDLTTTVFIENPFNPTQQLYKTGDLGRWTENGEIEFFGRKDNQYKIRGYRVELEEIERQLEKIEGIETGIVTALKNTSGDYELVAYFTGTENLAIKEIRQSLAEVFPSFMIPSYFMRINEVPFSKSGKIDKKSLPSLSEAEMDTGIEFVLAKDGIETELMEIWKTVLKRDRISTKDNFFDLGGHSLKATQAVSRIQRNLEIKLNLREFFSNPTIESLALYLEKQERNSYKGIEVIAKSADYELSNPQRRLWIIDQLGGNKSVYNMSGAVTIGGNLNVEAFSKAFDTIIERHEILRTVFINLDGNPRQKIIDIDEFNFKLEFEDISGKEGKLELAKELAKKSALHEFDLATGPLLIAKIIKLEDSKHIFTYTIHHIISDGWSMEILINEVTALYKAYQLGTESPLSPLKLQYKDFAAWQNERISNVDEAYWMKKLSGNPDLINIPTDFPKDEFNEGIGEQERIRIEEELVLKLKEAAKKHDTTLSNVVLTVFNILLSQLSGQTDILIGMTSANRNHPDIEDLIGFFVNSLVIRTDLSGDLSFGDLIEQVKINTAEAFEHQNYPFDLLVEKLSPERFTNHQPLVNVTYSFQNLKDVVLESDQAVHSKMEKQDSLQISGFYFGEGNNTSKFDILLFVNEIEGELDLNFEYNSAIFKRTTIQKYLGYFKRFITMVAEGE